MHCLKNGQVFELRDGEEVLRVGGIRGSYGPSNFDRRSSTLQGLRQAPLHARRD
jgi:hypothetical protein